MGRAILTTASAALLRAASKSGANGGSLTCNVAGGVAEVELKYVK
jgi:hypothetical protein